ncbi:MAG: WG repeat-containing protein [Bacteroidetes bacterium]|nr:WG repeat-containing protein [Bacteroidota bacterium]
MKNLIIIIICLQFQFVSFAQIFNDVDEVTPFQEELAAIKKGSQWGFINKEGTLVIDYRNDLVLTNIMDEMGKVSTYPVFNNERCLIKKLIGDIYYYGFIDKTGNVVIKPNYLNATNFKNGFAIVIITSKDVIGHNEVLKKDIIYSKIEDFIINPSGEMVRYLENPRSNNSPKTKPKTPPVFYSKFIAPHLIAVKKKDQKWDIYEF